MRYIRTKDGIYTLIAKEPIYELNGKKYYCVEEQISSFSEDNVIAQADTVAELCDEIVLIENDNEHNIVYLQEAYDRIDEYHEQGNYEPRLIGRIKVGLDKKAVAEWKENEQGLYDWVLL